MYNNNDDIIVFILTKNLEIMMWIILLITAVALIGFLCVLADIQNETRKYDTAMANLLKKDEPTDEEMFMENDCYPGDIEDVYNISQFKKLDKFGDFDHSREDGK